MQEPNELTDEELLDAFHESRATHRTAGEGERNDAYLRRKALEAEMIRRWGIGQHMKEYRKRHPEDAS